MLLGRPPAGPQAESGTRGEGPLALPTGPYTSPMTKPTGTRNPIVADTVMVELLWTQDAFPAANILHAGYSGDPPGVGDCENIAALINGAFFTGDIVADYPTSTVFVGCRVTDLASDTGASGESAVNLAGTAEDAGTVASACVLASWSIARRYRGGHPRTYFPALAFGALANPGQWDAGVVSDFTAAIGNLSDVLGSASSEGTSLTGQVIVSYVLANAYRDTNITYPVTGGTVSNRIRTQRRRLTSSSF